MTVQESGGWSAFRQLHDSMTTQRCWSTNELDHSAFKHGAGGFNCRPLVQWKTRPLQRMDRLDDSGLSRMLRLAYCPELTPWPWTDLNETCHKYSLCEEVFKVRGQRSRSRPDRLTYIDIHFDMWRRGWLVLCNSQAQSYYFKRMSEGIERESTNNESITTAALVNTVRRQRRLSPALELHGELLGNQRSSSVKSSAQAPCSGLRRWPTLFCRPRSGIKHPSISSSAREHRPIRSIVDSLQCRRVVTP